MSNKLVIISARGEESFLPEQVNKIKLVGDVIFHAQLDPLTEDEFISMTQDADIVAITRRSVKHLPKKTLKFLPRLKGLAIYSTGYEWVDHYYLAEKNITLSYLKNYSTVTVAEHTLGLILCMSRRIHLSYDKVRQRIPSYVSLHGWELEHKKLGIIGFGRIGQKVAELALAFGLQVYYYDVKQKQRKGVTYLPLDELLATCQIISLHASRKYQEPPILDEEKISIFRKDACLINAGRPELVDTSALISAINAGKLVGYAIDETLDRSLINQLNDYGRILETGHSAWYSKEAIARGMEEWTSNIVSMAIGQPENVLNLEE